MGVQGAGQRVSACARRSVLSGTVTLHRGLFQALEAGGRRGGCSADRVGRQYRTPLRRASPDMSLVVVDAPAGGGGEDGTGSTFHFHSGWLDYLPAIAIIGM